MAKSRSLQQAVRFALATATAVSGVTALHAQQAPAPTAAPVEEVVVTGSRLKTPNDTSISPITTVTAADIQSTGLTRVEDVLNNLPMVFAGMNSTTSNGADGTSTIDLRGLGPQRTLVLVNGRRLGPGTGDGRNFSDVNQIPASLIQSIDIETGGASATYGADAVAGVVNFQLNTHFEGVKVDAGYNFNQHDNHNNYLQSLQAQAGDVVGSGNVNTGFGKNASVLIGSNFSDNKGNVTMYATWDQQGATTQQKYDYGACSLGVASPTQLACLGSPVGPNGNILGYGTTPGGHSGNIFDYAVDPHTGNLRNFSDATDTFNYGPYNYYQRPNTRWTAGGFLHYDINSHIQAYMEVMFTRNSTVAQIAPAGSFGETTAFIPCADPLLSAQQAGVLCSPANLAAQGNPTQVINGTTYNGVNLYFLRRNVEGGGRQADFTSNAMRVVAGLRGDINDVWSYDIYAQHGTVDGNNTNNGYFNIGNISNALTVVPGATGPVCAVGGSCVPYNVWTPGGVTQAALNYLYTPQLIELTTQEYVVSGSVTADLGKYGIKLPTADNGIQFNVGAEYRQESSAFSPDEVTQTGDASGLGGASPPVSGNFHVQEVFTEIGVPLLEHMPLAEELKFDGGYRYSKYSEGFDTNTYKLGLEWTPIQDIRARASFQRAVRAPNISELYSPQAVGLDGSIDPCSGATPTASQAACLLTGVSAAQYGHINPNSSNQYNGLLGGNPNLKPEVADTYSAGIQLQPRWVPNLTFSADYFNIKINDAIGPVGADAIINNCVNTGSAATCDLVHRAPGTGSLWLGNQGYVVDTNVNLGSEETKGIDFKGGYRLPMQHMGSLLVQLEATYLISLDTTPLEGGASYDCVGYYGVTCGGASPKWRGVTNVTWSTPWDGLDLTARWRYIGEGTSENSSPYNLLNGAAPADNAPFAATKNIAAYNYIDLSASFNIVANVRGTVGVNNIADKDPPIVVGSDCSTSSPGGANCNGNTFPGVYDSLGRYIYMHVTAQF